MTLSVTQWHQRYIQQAVWTQDIRRYIYEKIGIQRARRILDIGCGTGVLENELNQLCSADIFGLDLDFDPLRIARDYASKSKYSTGDCLHLPYRDRVFDISLCHFLLLWVTDVTHTLEELRRVTSPRGYILALAEPDYGGRIDFPDELSQIGKWQAIALRQQGANPLMGRQLRSLFSGAGLENIEVGVLGGQWHAEKTNRDGELEWDIIQSDLSQNIEFLQQSENLKTLDFTSRRNSQRVLYVPTFYAIGIAPG